MAKSVDLDVADFFLLLHEGIDTAEAFYMSHQESEDRKEFLEWMSDTLSHYARGGAGRDG